MAISDDESFLIFSSDKDNGFGKEDLYICKKLPNKEWSEPSNLGSLINTEYNESNPVLTDNGNTLYFSSEGHNSMGGNDVFMSYYDEIKKKWSKPVNLGYPINTALDNIGISFTKNKKYAYVSTNRKDSYGDLDIYKVDFLDVNPSYTLIKGYVLDTDSNTIKKQLTIEVFDALTDELTGLYEVNAEKGSFLMVLPPSNYQVSIDIPGKGFFTETLVVGGRNKYQKEISHNIKVNFDPPLKDGN
jgi:hypothetical protein